MGNRRRRSYIEVTSDLSRRVYDHKHGLVPGFTSKHLLERRYFEETAELVAIAHEKELKGWRCSKKIALIEKLNPHAQISAMILSSSLLHATPDKSLRGDPSPTPPNLHPASFGMTAKGPPGHPE